ncbi:beta-galactosidase [Haloferula sp. A504]|uniref:beta-galactosidase n=1 Tax=Haloferula sp. A504 TaxID=3373601 RepID=UPI0031C1D94D|nr:beta-galactosidase [Verrucomicrobiaceae bacterium E54]
MRSAILLGLLLAAVWSPRGGFADEARFFPEKGTHFGVYYYPEHWPEEQWERDIRRVAELGFDFIHYGEFAWARLEPEDGKFDFAWMDKAVALAADHGLKVLMSTPSPCPPAWLATAHPEILAVDRNGVRGHHRGSRLTGSLANPVYRKHVERIVTKLAERYARDERVWGWQIGNEPHIQTGEDYSPSAQAEFREWLKRKYGTVEALNEAWGAAFWSYTLDNFEQVQVPTSNPHTYLDFQTYTSEEIARDLGDQAAIVRRHGDGRQWITTNYAYYQGLENVNPFLTRDTLDFASHTMYLTHNRKNSSGDSLAHRLGCGMEYSLGEELAASVSGYTGIMELQPGQINWGRFNAMPMPGAVRMWVWHAFGMGERFVCTYRFRQPLFGMEQFHHGIMQTDGVSVSHGGKDFVRAVAEINRLEEKLDPSAENEFVNRSRTALLWSNRNLLDIERYPHHQDWDTWQHIYTYYQGLKRMGVNVVFVGDGDDFDPAGTPFMVVPAYQMMSRELVGKLEDYVAKGGHLIISTRSGLKDDKGHLWEAKIQQPIWNLIGGEIEYYDHLPANRPGKVAFGGKSYPWHTWGTVVKPGSTVESWGTYEDQFYEGASAILHRDPGKGSVTYVGAWSDDWELEYDLLRRVYGKELGKLPFDLPPYVFVHYRQGLWVAVNYTDQMIDVPAGGGAEWLLGGRELPPAGVSVWRAGP